jgi:Asparaginase, N-terminal
MNAQHTTDHDPGPQGLAIPYCRRLFNRGKSSGVRARRLRPAAVLLLASAVAPMAPCAGQEPPAINRLPLVWVLSTGGTISGKGSSSTSLTEYKAGSLLGQELVNAVPAIQQYARVKVEQIVNVGSPDITIEHWMTLAKRINRIFAEDPEVAGVVVTHGTNTLEETAYFLNLTVKYDRPVVMGRLDASRYCYQCGWTAEPAERHSRRRIERGAW